MPTINGARPVAVLPLAQSLERYGRTPFGDCIYRVVWSESRLHQVGGAWPDGVTEYRFVPRYGGVQGWVLEKWLSAQAYAGTKEQYDMQNLDLSTGLYITGPYPTRGEFEQCFVFPAGLGTPSFDFVCRTIDMLRAGLERHTAQERRKALTDAVEKKQNAKHAVIDDMVHEAMDGVVSARVSAGNPAKRTKNDIKFRYSAQDSARIIGNKPKTQKGDFFVANDPHKSRGGDN